MAFADTTNTAGIAASGTTNAGNPVKVGAAYNSTAPTPASGQVVDLQTDASGNLKVNVINGISAVTATGPAASGGTNTGNPVKVGAAYNSTAPTLATGEVADLQADVNGNLKTNVTNGISSGTAGSPSAQVISVQGVTGGTSAPVQPSPGAGGGALSYNVIAPATPAAVDVQSGAGKIWTLHCSNSGSALAYLKIFDGAAPTLGTTAASYSIPIPYNTQGGGFTISYPVGRKITTNMYVAVTGGIALTDDSAITANTVVVDITYSP